MPACPEKDARTEPCYHVDTAGRSRRKEKDMMDTNVSEAARMTKRTRVHAVRDAWKVRDRCSADIVIFHEPSLGDVMAAIDRCFSDWYMTEKGKKAWEYSCEEYNIGDYLSGGRPDDEFTARYGFVIREPEEDALVDISYDRIWGDREREPE